MTRTIVRSMLVSLVLTAVGVVWVVYSVGEPSDLLVVLDLQPAFGILAVASALAAFSFAALRMVYVCRRMSFPLRFRHALRTHLLSMFSAAVTPGGAGNTPAIALMLQHHGASSSAAWATGVAVFRADAVFHAWGVPFALIGLFALGTIPPTRAWLLVGGVTLVATVLFAWILQFKLHWLRPVASRLLRGPLLRFRRAGIRFVDGTLGSDRLFAQAPLPWQVNVQVLTAASWLAYFSVLYFLALGLGVPLSWLEAIAMQLVVVTTSVVVPTPGGSGFFEVGVSWLLIAEGGGENVPAVVLLWRLVTFYSSFVFGPLLGGYVVAKRLQSAQAPHAR